jgi:hypothetical protein
MQWFLAHWKDLLIAVLGVDAALLPLFPQSGILLKIKDFLSGIVNK